MLERFITNISGSDVDIYNIESLDRRFEYNHEIECCEFTVRWTLELELREWGVKDIVVNVEQVTGEFDVVFFDGEGDETTRETVAFDSQGWKPVVDFVTNINQISPSTLLIDYKDKTVEVSE